MAPEKPLTVREACRRKQPLDGTDAQALEHALTITERERDAARADNAAWESAAQKFVDLFDPVKPKASPALLSAVAIGAKNANQTLRERLEKAQAEILKAQKALGNGADDEVWRPGESAVDALIRALGDADNDVARYRERLAEIVELVGEGGDGSAFGSVESMLATFTERQEVYQRQRDEARAENAAWRKATGRDDPEALDSYLGRAGIDSHLKVLTELMTKAEAQRDEARAELAFIEAEYAKANASDLTRDALAMQNAVLRADLESVDSDDRIAARRWQAEAMRAHGELAKARAEIERLRRDREAGCENTPTKDCECPGCCTARERAERGEA